jgi:hypothetical protein
VATLALTVWPASRLPGQPRQEPTILSPEPSESHPIECWHRTSASAVRAGEPFTLILTCALLNTAATTVIVDETGLDASAARLAPFDVIGGRHVPPVNAPDRRFLQYEFELRLIADTAFGQDVKLPVVPIKYRLQTRLPDGALNEGIEQTYSVAPASVRLLSLVPADASDIRDQPALTFADLQSGALRARMMTTAGAVLMALAGLVGILGLVQVTSDARSRRSARPAVVPPRAVLRSVAHELDAVRDAREVAGWSPELAGRALTALRIAAAHALARPISQRAIDSDDEEVEVDGVLVLRRTVSGRRFLISGATTSETVGQARRPAKSRRAGSAPSALLARLEDALASLTRARYGRVEGLEPRFDHAALDESIRSSRQLVRELLREQSWSARLSRSLAGRMTRLRRRLWPR